MEKRGCFILVMLFLAAAMLSMQAKALVNTQIWNATLENSTGSAWYGVTVDLDNNPIVVGVSTGSRAGIVKYNSTGAMLWEVNLSGAVLEDVVTDSDKNIYAVGSNSNSDPFVLKYDTNGNHIWNMSYNNGTFGRLFGIIITPDQNLLISGYDSASSIYYPIVISYDLNGNHIWNTSFAATGYFDYSVDIDLDSQNNIYIPVYAMNSTFQTIAYLFKLNSTGSLLWNFSYFGDTGDLLTSVKVDASDKVYTTIQHSNPSGDYSTIIVKFNSTGSQIWNRTWDCPKDADPFGIDLDSNENVIVAIEYRNLTSPREMMYVKYDPDGYLIYNSTHYMRAWRAGPYAVAIDSNDKIYLAGRSGYNNTHYNRVLVQWDDDIPSWKNFYKVGATTYLYNQSDLEAISGLTLASTTSSVKWNQNVSVKDADIDTYASMGSGYVSFNMPYLNNTFNASANVSIDVSTCDNWIIYYSDHHVTSLEELRNEGYIVGNNMAGCMTSYCSNPVCSGNKLNYTVTHFDGTGGEGDASPTAVPEFSTITLILTVIITLTGFIAIRQKNK